MSTWHDLKLAVLQKMFAADDKVVVDESTMGYLAAMPHCANEGLALLATAGKFITKSVKIAQMDIANLVSQSIADAIHEFSDSYYYSVDEGQSYYFEASGTGTCDIYVDEVLTDTVIVDNVGYEVYKGLIVNPDKKQVRFEFTTVYPMGLRNVAIYKELFADAEDVPPYTDKVKYDLKALAPDFYMIDPQGIYYEGAYQKYLRNLCSHPSCSRNVKL